MDYRMADMIDGVPTCYGSIERRIFESSGTCLQCDHLKGCEEYAKELGKSWNAFRHDMRIAEMDNLRRTIQSKTRR